MSIIRQAKGKILKVGRLVSELTDASLVRYVSRLLKIFLYENKVNSTIYFAVSAATSL